MMRTLEDFGKIAGDRFTADPGQIGLRNGAALLGPEIEDCHRVLGLGILGAYTVPVLVRWTAEDVQNLGEVSLAAVAAVRQVGNGHMNGKLIATKAIRMALEQIMATAQLMSALLATTSKSLKAATAFADANLPNSFRLTEAETDPTELQLKTRVLIHGTMRALNEVIAINGIKPNSKRPTNIANPESEIIRLTHELAEHTGNTVITYSTAVEERVAISLARLQELIKVNTTDLYIQRKVLLGVFLALLEIIVILKQCGMSETMEFLLATAELDSLAKAVLQELGNRPQEADNQATVAKLDKIREAQGLAAAMRYLSEQEIANML